MNNNGIENSIASILLFSMKYTTDKTINTNTSVSLRANEL